MKESTPRETPKEDVQGREPNYEKHYDVPTMSDEKILNLFKKLSFNKKNKNEEAYPTPEDISTQGHPLVEKDIDKDKPRT
ncbi:MAG: hypothetical protein KBB88_01545 [Candidatus Pacebacteria bacterium]|nr:hypothetical protein [Candidatus Paceibacterota bacterium]